MASWGKIEWDSVLIHIPKGVCIHSLDMQEIMPNYAFETMGRFSKELGIYKELEKHLFEELINGGDL